MTARRTYEELERKLNADPSGGTGLPVHTRASIEAAEARAFGRPRKWTPSLRPKRSKPSA